MKKYKKLVLLTIMMILSGCTMSTVNTTLTINDDLSGERQMVFTIDREVFESDYDGTFTHLHDVVASSAPKGMKITSDEASLTMKATITFSSLEEYEKIIEKITAEDETIEVIRTDGTISTGTKVSESFSTSDLMEWVKKALIDSKIVADNESGNIYEVKSTNVKIGGETFDATSIINVDTIEHLAIDKINIFTDIHANDKYSRKINFVIPNATLISNKEEIYTAFENLVPKGAKSEWQEKENNHQFIVTFKELELDELNKKTNHFLGNNISNLKVEENATNYFDETKKYTDGISLNYFNGNQDAIIKYWIRQPENYQLVGSEYYEVNEDGYSNLNFPHNTIDFTLIDIYPTNHIEIDLKSSIFSDSLTRTTTIHFTREISKDRQKQIIKKITVSDDKKKSEELNYSVKFKKEDKHDVLEIVQKGDAAKIDTSLKYLFGSDSVFLHDVKGGLFALKKQLTIRDDASYNGFIEITDDFKLTYTADLGLGAKELLEVGETKNPFVEGEQYKAESYELYNNIQYKGTYINLLAAGGVALILIAIAIIGFIYRSKIIDFLNKKKQ